MSSSCGPGVVARSAVSRSRATPTAAGSDRRDQTVGLVAPTSGLRNATPPGYQQSDPLVHVSEKSPSRSLRDGTEPPGTRAQRGVSGGHGGGCTWLGLRDSRCLAAASTTWLGGGVIASGPRRRKA